MYLQEYVQLLKGRIDNQIMGVKLLTVRLFRVFIINCPWSCFPSETTTLQLPVFFIKMVWTRSWSYVLIVLVKEVPKRTVCSRSDQYFNSLSRNLNQDRDNLKWAIDSAVDFCPSCQNIVLTINRILSTNWSRIIGSIF